MAVLFLLVDVTLANLVARSTVRRSFLSVKDAFSDHSLSQFNFLSGDHVRVQFPGAPTPAVCPASRGSTPSSRASCQVAVVAGFLRLVILSAFLLSLHKLLPLGPPPVQPTFLGR